MKKYEIETKGNLKIMGESLNKTIETLSELISIVVTNADNIAAASTQMSSSAQQLSEGATPLCDIGNLTDAISIAEKEYVEGLIPMSIIRVLPDKRKIRIDFKNEK